MCISRRTAETSSASCFPRTGSRRRSWRTGELPLWNPTLYGGAPFVADIQAGFLYPPNLILFLLWPEFPYAAMQWLSIGHIFWAGLGMYALLRMLRWPASRAGNGSDAAGGGLRRGCVPV